MRLVIRHNMEMAHRLLNDNGKCQNIHGHGMQVELVVLCTVGVSGMAVNTHAEVLEFGAMKKAFREYIDTTYDHRLVLNREDPFAGPIFMMDKATTVDNVYYEVNKDTGQAFLPGLSIVDGDPTVENLAIWIAEWACKQYRCDVIARIDETKTNGAEAMYHWNGFGASFAIGAR